MKKNALNDALNAGKRKKKKNGARKEEEEKKKEAKQEEETAPADTANISSLFESATKIRRESTSKIGMVITSAQKRQQAARLVLLKQEEEKRLKKMEEKAERKRLMMEAADGTLPRKALKKKMRKRADSNGNAGNGEEESEEEDWPAMKEFVKPPKDLTADRELQRLQREAKKLRPHAAAAAVGGKKSEVRPLQQLQQPSPAAGPSDDSKMPPRMATGQNGMVTRSRTPSYSSPTVPSMATVPPPQWSTGDGSQRRFTPAFHRRDPIVPREAPSCPLLEGVTETPKKPKHTRFRTESPKTGSVSPVKVHIGNGRMRKDSSPEISTTSSDDSSCDEKGAKGRKEQKKKLTKRRTTETSPAKKPSTPLSSPKKEAAEEETTPAKKKEEEKAKGKEQQPRMSALQRAIERTREIEEASLKGEEEGTVTSSRGVERRKKEEAKKGKVEVKKEEGGRARAGGEKGTRPVPDLLRMVAERLANSHGLLTFRLISNETRLMAERAMETRADDVLHLAEFDDENAFTRDDMTKWWEDQREAEDTTVEEGKETRSHAQVSAYLHARKVQQRLLKDADGGMSQPRTAAEAVETAQLLQHPLKTLDAACLLHESQTAAARRLLKRGAASLNEVWLGQADAELVKELKGLTAIEQFEHRQATMTTLVQLPLLQMTELRLDIVDEGATRETLADHLVDCVNLRALELNVAPTSEITTGSSSSHYALFTRRSYHRDDYPDENEWMPSNIEESEPDPPTRCLPTLEHLSTNVANVKLFWQLRDRSSLLQELQTLRVGRLTRTKELISRVELFADTKESRRFRQQGFFALRDAYETKLESVTLRLGDQVGINRLQRDVATIFEALGELPPSLLRFSSSFFYNQFSGVCAPFRKWMHPETVADLPETDHLHIEEMHLHFERAFDLRGLPALLPLSLKTLSIAINYETEEDARCLGTFLEMLSGLERLENLVDLHIQVWGVRCLQPIVETMAGCERLAHRLTRLAVSAFPVDDCFFEESSNAYAWLRLLTRVLFPSLQQLALHAACLALLIPPEKRRGYSWRNGLAWLANAALASPDVAATTARDADTTGAALNLFEGSLELAAAPALPALIDGEDYTITPNWGVEYDADKLVLAAEDEEELEEEVSGDETSFSRSHGRGESGDEDDDFITDSEGDEPDGDASHDALQELDEGLEDETEMRERRARRRDEKLRAAIERGEIKEEEEDHGELFDFDAISDEEDEEAQAKEAERLRCAFADDEAVESDGEGSGGEEGAAEEGEEEEEHRSEESADGSCSSEDEDREREEERLKEEARKQKRKERKQAQLESEEARKKRKRALDSEDEEGKEEIVIDRRSKFKKKKIIVESDEE